MRLAKYLAQSGIASRRRAEDLIMNGKVKVNGLVVYDLSTQVDPLCDSIVFDGEPVEDQQLIYILLYKPPGCISSVYDPQGRPTVLDLLTGINVRIYPVGRLDYDTEGLILLSNDGHFTNLMIHPRYGMEKTYEAWVKGYIKDEELERLRQGVLLEDGMTAPAGVRIIKPGREKSLIEIRIHEGRKRQVKRMCASIGHPVLNLKRTEFAFLNLDGLKQGQHRFLQDHEVGELQKMALTIRSY